MTFGKTPLNSLFPVASGNKLNSSVSSAYFDMIFSKLIVGLSTVVKQRLYSYIILGYKELKSNNKTIFS